jgi:hypothetical protein
VSPSILGTNSSSISNIVGNCDLTGLEKVVIAKVWSSCIRKESLREELTRGGVAQEAWVVREGDIVLAKVKSELGAYRMIENAGGRNVRLYRGDIVGGVLGTRRSGTNMVGALPERLAPGAEVHLISPSGILGHSKQVPRYQGSDALTLEVLGLGLTDNGHAANTIEDVRIPSLTRSRDNVWGGRLIVVCGTSAECGKTSAICSGIRAVESQNSNAKIGALKVCGTGRLRDLFEFRDAGARYVTDFVEYGWPTTYNIPVDTYRELVDSMLSGAMRQTDILFVEIGGDLLDGMANEALIATARENVVVVLMANDAMGALRGVQICKERGFKVIHVGSIRQNVSSLGQRVGQSCFDPYDNAQMAALFED